MFITYSTSFAQISKGTYQIGGLCYIRSLKQSDYKEKLFEFQLSTNLSKYLSHNFALGLSLGLEYQSFGGNSESKIKVGPIARYYLYKQFFTQAMIRYYHQDMPFTIVNIGDKSNWLEGELGLGLSYWLNNSLAIEPIFYFNINKLLNPLNDGSVDVRNIGLSIGIQGFLSNLN